LIQLPTKSNKPSEQHRRGYLCRLCFIQRWSSPRWLAAALLHLRVYVCVNVCLYSCENRLPFKGFACVLPWEGCKTHIIFLRSFVFFSFCFYYIPIISFSLSTLCAWNAPPQSRFGLQCAWRAHCCDEKLVRSWSCPFGSGCFCSGLQAASLVPALMAIKAKDFRVAQLNVYESMEWLVTTFDSPQTKSSKDQLSAKWGSYVSITVSIPRFVLWRRMMISISKVGHRKKSWS